ncbi:hypothetical protein VC83_03204 [Pseudogymnoascus destructans]|uniref:Uncharacterized protein n=1 Tax=Pseudogymnoascus destructans TaxID=655981 RepID=A0A177AFL6_9PEZI|nr:uncharacterized protein VC83_03204 [Pseudogymnoascus destructans]OAF59944.1 hypothetical protein VC83_03204 [Pseudogymnoascus destructans]
MEKDLLRSGGEQTHVVKPGISLPLISQPRISLPPTLRSEKFGHDDYSLHHPGITMSDQNHDERFWGGEGKKKRESRTRRQSHSLAWWVDTSVHYSTPSEARALAVGGVGFRGVSNLPCLIPIARGK